MRYLNAFISKNQEDWSGMYFWNQYMSEQYNVKFIIHDNPAQLPCKGDIVVFGGAQWKAAMPSVRWTEGRLQILPLGGDSEARVTCTFDARHLLPSNASALRIPLCHDILWAASTFESGYQDPGVDITGPCTWPTDLIGFDIETTGLEFWNQEQRIVCASMSYRDGPEYASTLLPKFNKMLNSGAVLAGHNIKFDINWWQYNVGEINAPLWSTDVAAFLLDDTLTDNSLAYHTSRGLGWPYHKDVDRANIEGTPIHQLLHYCATDAKASQQLATYQRIALKDKGLLPMFGLYMDAIKVFSKMERRGVYLDREWLARTREENSTALKEAEGVLRAYVENPRSSAQVSKLLYQTFRIPVQDRTENGVPSTSKTALDELAWANLNDEQAQIVDKVLNFRVLDKLESSFLGKLADYARHDGRVHTTYGVGKGEFGGTVTGRTSSREPNLQNIPSRKDVRGCFSATPGYTWFDADYTGLELGVVADLANEQVFIEALMRGQNLHTATMAAMYRTPYDVIQSALDAQDDTWKLRRRTVKIINFGILYGIGPAKLARTVRQAGIAMEMSEARDMIDRWLDTHSGIAAWIKATEAQAIKQGYVTAPTGQRRTTVGASANTGPGRRILRQACNFPVQHVASTILLTAMILLDRKFKGKDFRLLLNVHDQVAGEFRGMDEGTVSTVIHEVMTQQVPKELEVRFDYKLRVPLSIDLRIGERWS